MSKQIFPHIEPSLSTTNMYSRLGIVVDNYLRLLNYHKRYCGTKSNWFYRDEVFKEMLIQSRLIKHYKLAITKFENERFPYGI